MEVKDDGLFKGGHAANLAHVRQDHEKVRQIAGLAHDLGLLIHIDGMPFGKALPRVAKTGEGA